MTLLRLNFENFRYVGAMGSVLIIAREIPDMSVSTREASVKYRVSMVSVVFVRLAHALEYR
jgi:hypothetical protein